MSERDITERLRNPGWNGYVYDSDREDGAAEIERLRAQNEDLMVMVHGETEKVAALTARCAELEKAGERILPHLRWTISDESPGHHPTMPSAVAAFTATLQRQDNG